MEIRRERIPPASSGPATYIQCFAAQSARFEKLLERGFKQSLAGSGKSPISASRPQFRALVFLAQGTLSAQVATVALHVPAAKYACAVSRRGTVKKVLVRARIGLYEAGVANGASSVVAIIWRTPGPRGPEAAVRGAERKARRRRPIFHGAQAPVAGTPAAHRHHHPRPPAPRSETSCKCAGEALPPATAVLTSPSTRAQRCAQAVGGNHRGPRTGRPPRRVRCTDLGSRRASLEDLRAFNDERPALRHRCGPRPSR